MKSEAVDTRMRLQAFEHVQRLSELHDHLTAEVLRRGFTFEGTLPLGVIGGLK